MNNKSKIILRTGIYNGNKIIRIIIPHNQFVMNALKSKTEAKWNTNTGYWYISADKFRLRDFFEAMKSIAYIDYSDLKYNKQILC